MATLAKDGMKITAIEQSALADVLGHVAPISATRSPNPIVICMVMVADAEARTVTLRATDFARSISYTIPDVDVATSGAVCVPARRLMDSVRVLDKAVPLTIQETTEGVRIKSGRTKFDLRGMDWNDFPTLATLSVAESFELDAKHVCHMIEMVAFACANEKTRYSLNGVLFEMRRDKLTLVGTDGKRLAMIERAAEIGKDYHAHIIVPHNALDLLKWVCDDAAGSIRLEVQENQILARTDSATVAIQLVSGLFPAFRQVLPDEMKLTKRATIDRESFARHLRRAQQFTAADSSSVRFSFDSGKLTMRSRSKEEGDAEVEMDVEFASDPMEIGFDPKLVADGLRTLRGETLTMMMRDCDSAAIVREERDDFSFLYLVMPTELGDA